MRAKSDPRKPKDRPTYRLYPVVNESTYKEVRHFAQRYGLSIPQAARAMLTAQARYLKYDRDRRRGPEPDGGTIRLAQKLLEDEPQSTKAGLYFRLDHRTGGTLKPEKLREAVEAAFAAKGSAQSPPASTP